MSESLAPRARDGVAEKLAVVLADTVVVVVLEGVVKDVGGSGAAVEGGAPRKGGGRAGAQRGRGGARGGARGHRVSGLCEV